jgi:hypothetical protein
MTTKEQEVWDKLKCLGYTVAAQMHCGKNTSEVSIFACALEMFKSNKVFQNGMGLSEEVLSRLESEYKLCQACDLMAAIVCVRTEEWPKEFI